MPSDGYGLGDVRRFEVDAERSFGEYRKSAAGAGGAGIEPTRSSIEEDSAAIREQVASARERTRERIETDGTETAGGFGEGRDEIFKGRESLQHSTEGVRKRLDNARTEGASQEQKTSEIKKTIESNRTQQRKNDRAG